MKLILAELVERVDNGEKFHIDFEKRDMKVGKEYLIKDGIHDTNKYVLSTNTEKSLTDTLSVIEELYYDYKHSIPSERSESKRKKYFKALPVDKLTDEQLVYGESREIAQCVLEGYILIQILMGTLYWDEELMGKWFYKGLDPDFILLKKWIEK